jgi:anti-anti-sigma factor
VTEHLSLVTVGSGAHRSVRIAGELDASTAPELARYLAPIDAPAVSIDLTDCAFADAAGLRALYVAYQRSLRRGTHFRITGASGAVLRAMQASGFDELIAIQVAS